MTSRLILDVREQAGAKPYDTIEPDLDWQDLLTAEKVREALRRNREALNEREKARGL